MYSSEAMEAVTATAKVDERSPTFHSSSVLWVGEWVSVGRGVRHDRYAGQLELLQHAGRAIEQHLHTMWGPCGAVGRAFGLRKDKRPAQDSAGEHVRERDPYWLVVA
jgi:hypothetical protein